MRCVADFVAVRCRALQCVAVHCIDHKMYSRICTYKFTIQIIVLYILWCSTIFFKNVVLHDVVLQCVAVWCSVLQCVAGCNVVLCCSVMCSPYACVAVCKVVRFFDLYVHCALQLS